MAIEMNAFNEAAKLNGRLALADNLGGAPTIISAREGLKEKLLSMLNHVPLLKDTRAVKEYVSGLSIDNRQLLGVFLHALASRYGNEVAMNVSDNLDLSGHSPLNARTIERATTEADGLHSLINARQANLSEESGELRALDGTDALVRRQVNSGARTLSHLGEVSRPSVIELDTNSDIPKPNVSAYKHEFSEPVLAVSKVNQSFKFLQTKELVEPLKLPKGQTWLASWVYSEAEPIKTLQQEVKDFNRLVSRINLSARVDELSLAKDILADPVELSVRQKRLETDLSTLNQTLVVLKQSGLNMPQEYRELVAPLLDSIDKQKQVCDGLLAATKAFSTALSDTAALRQDIAKFNAQLPMKLQAKLSSSQQLSCYQMFAPFMADSAKVGGESDSQVLELSAAMGNHLTLFLSQGGAKQSESLPDVKTLVQCVLLIQTQSATLSASLTTSEQAHQELSDLESAQQFVSKVLVEAKSLDDAKMGSLAQELQLEQKSRDMNQSAVQFTRLLREVQLMDPQIAEAEDNTYASLLYLGGLEVLAKGNALVFDEPVLIDDLNLAEGITAEIIQSANLPHASQLAIDVLQAQHKLAWHRGMSSVSHSPNNQQNIDLDQDIARLRLASEITQNKAAYLSFFAERQPMCEAYQTALVSLISSLPEGQVSEQLVVQLATVKLERDANGALFTAIEAQQKVEDTLVIAGNQNKRLLAMSQDLTVYVQEMKAERARINLQEYLAFLPDLQSNNAQVRELTEQKQILTERVSTRESYLKDLYGSDWKTELTDPQLSSPELRAYLNESAQLTQVQSKLSTCDEKYEACLLQLKQSALQAQKQGGYPDQGVSTSAEAWQSWIVQKFVGSWSGQYRPSMEALILERQLAKNNMSNMGEAYLALAKTVKGSSHSPNPMSAVASLASPKGMASAFGDLHNWSMSHPIEARELAGNLTHAYHIITANPGTFGQELVNTVKTVWQTGTVKSQVHDILNGTREELPDKANFSMTPEMIALLHMAQMAPYVAGGAKGAANAGIGGPVLTRVFSMMLPGAGIAAPVVGLVGGLLQTWSEGQLAKQMSGYRSTEVMVNALIKGMQADGGLAARGKAVAGYMVQRQALLEVGTLARDSFEVGKLGAMKRFISDGLNWWKHATPGAKVFAVVTTLVATVGLSAAAVAATLLTLGTGGLGIVAAVGLGTCGAALGGLLARGFRSSLLDSNFLGMGDTARQVERDMTSQRIELALARLGRNALTDDAGSSKTLGDLLSLESSEQQARLRERITDQLVALEPAEQAEMFSHLMTNHARIKGADLDNIHTHQRENVIEAAQTHLQGLGVSKEELLLCMAEVDNALGS